MSGAGTRSLLARAIALRQAGDRAAATAAVAEALAAFPDDPDALHLSGVLAFEAGDAALAATQIGLALRARPRDPRFERSRAIVATALGRLDEAIEATQRALAGAPHDAALKTALVRLLLDRAASARAAGRRAAALDDCRAAVAILPDDLRALNDLALALAEAGNDVEAEAAFRRAVALPAPLADAPRIAANFGNWLRRRGRHAEAQKFLETAVHLDPTSESLRLSLADALGAVERRQIAAAWHVARAIEARPALLDEGPADADHTLLFPLYVLEDGPGHRRMAERWAAATATGAPPPPARPRDPRPDRRLRIGYVSGDFRVHAVANFLIPILEAHDREAFELVAYSASAATDEITERCRALADRWVDAFELDDAALAARVAADGVDILVDLSGHTRHERLATFRRRPAPLQLTWMGFPATTGLGCFDARVTDAFADPPGLTEAHFTEPLARLDPGFLAYRPVHDLPPPTQAAAGRAMTFGSFANAAKINRRTLRLWARVLAAAPGARLLLKPLAGANPLIADELRRMAREAGIAPERLELRPPIADWKDQFAVYADLDTALDTVPYAGTTTTCEALWMGVPVVTLAGTTHASRVGASLLARAGLAEFVARGEDEFVAAAANLATSAERRAAWRQGLRAQVAGSALGDARAVTRAFEGLCRRLWAARCHGGAPPREGLGAPAQIA